MSRYLKDVSAINFRFKKYLNVTGLYSIAIPPAIKQVKSIAFGGGGNSCSTSICSCSTITAQYICCCCIRGHFSGAGGGFSEKTWFGIGGMQACVCVASCENTSYVCFSGLGCSSATGGTGVGTTCRTMTSGCGFGGDINAYGNIGFCRCTWAFCRYDCCFVNCCSTNAAGGGACACIYAAACSCFYSDLFGVHLSGGTPGNTICCRVNKSDDLGTAQRCCCYMLNWGYIDGNNGGDSPSYYIYFNNYYCRKSSSGAGDWILSCTFTTVPGLCWGFPSWYCTTVFPQGPTSCIDPYYTYDWDPINNTCCTCDRATCSGVGSYCSCGGGSSVAWGTSYWYCCYWNCYCYVNRNNESCAHTFLGAPGFGCAVGTIGGGGAGIWNGDAVRCATDYSRGGGQGLVVLHY